MKSGKTAVLEAQGPARHDSSTDEIPDREQSSEGWRLPSGTGLAEFVLQSGFLASRLWEESRKGRHGHLEPLPARVTAEMRPGDVR